MWASILDVKYVGKSQILKNCEKKWTDVMEIDHGNENLRNTFLRVGHTISAAVMEIDLGNENLQNTYVRGSTYLSYKINPYCVPGTFLTLFLRKRQALVMQL